MSLPEYFNDTDANTYFKLMLAMLGKYDLPPNMINMHLFYNYVAKTNDELNEEIDDYLKNHETFSKEVLLDFYELYIWDKEKRDHNVLNKTIQEQFNSIGANISSIQIGNKESNHSIVDRCKTITQVNVPDEIKDAISDIVSETRNIIKSNSGFEKELDDKKLELEELKKELEETKEQVDTDPMTSLKNRRFFETVIGNEIYLARNKENTLSLVYLDIDHFKNVNDTYGHLIGDKVIKFVADAMKEVIGDKGTVARMGGEEFAILLPKTSLEISRQVSEVIRKKLKRQI